ncbi:MAG: hypothetical protein JXX28_15020 [Deltaproteobacteria bacterium]|nr:hypothetical protein [Deltaproteobacteria bacterium]
MVGLILLISFALVALLGPPVVRLCWSLGMVAGLDDRRLHKDPTPHGGGIAMVAVGLPLMLLAVRLWDGIPYPRFITVMLIASAAVAAIGWLDDRYEVRASVRLGVHLIAGLAGLAVLPQLFFFLPLVAEKVILAFAWGWFVNLYNFMDGADGQAAGEAVVIGLGIAVIVPALAPLAVVMMGVGLGFLRVNWHPARVFMGDVGSTWLGYVLGGLLFVALIDYTWTVIWPLATVTLFFSVDATWTLFRRLGQGYRPWVPHKTFWFHRYLALGHTPSQLALGAWGLNIGLLAIAITGHRLQLRWVTIALGLAWVLVAMLAVRLAEGRQKALAASTEREV